MKKIFLKLSWFDLMRIQTETEKMKPYFIIFKPWEQPYLLLKKKNLENPLTRKSQSQRNYLITKKNLLQKRSRLNYNEKYESRQHGLDNWSRWDWFIGNRIAVIFWWHWFSNRCPVGFWWIRPLSCQRQFNLQFFHFHYHYLMFRIFPCFFPNLNGAHKLFSVVILEHSIDAIQKSWNYLLCDRGDIDGSTCDEIYKNVWSYHKIQLFAAKSSCLTVSNW